jgi:hypothetical protein
MDRKSSASAMISIPLCEEWIEEMRSKVLMWPGLSPQPLIIGISEEIPYDNHRDDDYREHNQSIHGISFEPLHISMERLGFIYQYFD